MRLGIEFLDRRCYGNAYYYYFKLPILSCLVFAGKESQLTSVSEKVLETCKSKLLENEEHISQLERDIALAQEAVLKGAETEGFGRAPRTPMSGGNDDSLLGRSFLWYFASPNHTNVHAGPPATPTYHNVIPSNSCLSLLNLSLSD